MKSNQTNRKKTALAPSQIERFRDAARELGCSEDPEVFDKAIKKIAKSPPPDTVAKRKDKTKKPAK